MKLLTCTLLAALATGLAEAACKANNCVRAVTGTRADQSAQHRADCSSFLATTTTPATFTMTVTQTITPATTVVTVVIGTSTILTTTTEEIGCCDPFKPRGITVDPPTATAKTVPPYATACNGPPEYSSACSCWGVTRSTATAATPTATATVTVTTTATQTTGITTLTTSISVTTVTFYTLRRRLPVTAA